MRCGGGGADDVGALDGFGCGAGGVNGNVEALSHFGAKFFAPGYVAAKGACGFQLSNTGHSFQLRAGLSAGADDGGDAGVRAREKLSGHAGSGAGAQLAHVVGFDQSQEVASGNFVKQHEKSNFSGDVGVLLFGDEAGGIIGGGHVMKKTLGSSKRRRG